MTPSENASSRDDFISELFGDTIPLRSLLMQRREKQQITLNAAGRIDLVSARILLALENPPSNQQQDDQSSEDAKDQRAKSQLSLPVSSLDGAHRGL